MDKLKVEAKTVEEAVEQGLKQLEISRDQAEINIISHGSKGFLGLIGGKDAEVEIKKKIDPVKLGQDFLNDLFSSTNLNVEVEVQEKDYDESQVKYNLHSPDLGIVIGHRGETLDAIQYLSSLAVNKKTDEYFRVLLDAEGYRERREKTLIRLANKLINKAVKKRRKVVLEPMPPHERRIIHLTVRDDPRVTSYSKGKEPFRKVMIELKDEEEIE